MKFKFLATTAAFITSLLNIKDIPVADAKVGFDEEQKMKIQAALPKGTSFEQLEEAFNKEITDALKNEQNDEQLSEVQREIKDLLKATGLTETELKSVIKDESSPDSSLSEQIQQLKGKFQEQDKLIQKLINDDEPDTPVASEKGKGSMKIAHSATHLYASGKDFDAFEGRNWNKRAAGLTTSATDYTDGATIEKLNGDMDLYFRENPDSIRSLHRDNFGLPAFWPKRFNVVDIIASGTIVTAEVSQARKLPWLPKNKQLIKPEEGKIYPVQIDLEYVGFFLQQIEASWLNMMNKEGSQPYKEHFVRFLVSEIDKKARVEDRISSINGVFVETPEDATTPAKFINRQNGLLYQLWKARDVDQKYKDFSVGTPTTANIVDYVDDMINRLPLEVRTSPGLVFYLSPYWLKSYKRRYEQLHGTQNDYIGYPKNPKDYNNIDFEVLEDMEGLDFMFITFNDNIEILENVPAEKSMYKFEYLKRIIYIWADYKLGIRMIHIGNKIKAGDPLEFKVQTVWSNNVPVFKNDFFIPLYDDTTGEVVVSFNKLKVESEWATDITDLKGLTPGTVVKIQGNTNMTSAKNVISNVAKIELTGGSFNLKSGGTLTLFVQESGIPKEVSRTTAPETAAPEAAVNFDATTIDAQTGSEFNYTGTDAKTLTDILNGVDGKSIVINGHTGGALTVSSVTGKISVASTALLDADGDYIELVKVDGVWYEVDRNIAV